MACGIVHDAVQHYMIWFVQQKIVNLKKHHDTVRHHEDNGTLLSKGEDNEHSRTFQVNVR